MSKTAKSSMIGEKVSKTYRVNLNDKDKKGG